MINSLHSYTVIQDTVYTTWWSKVTNISECVYILMLTVKGNNLKTNSVFNKNVQIVNSVGWKSKYWHKCRHLCGKVL